jgi:hypothetical protein
VLTSTRSGARGLRRKRRRGHLIPIALASVIAVGAIAAVTYLLWPTWEPDASHRPSALPVSVGGTLFNVPAQAFRMKVQKHSGPQERVDLNFDYPSLAPPEAPRHMNASDVEEEAMQPIDRIFLSISVHQDTLAPDERLRTIYPRYLDVPSAPGQDGLTMRAFRDGSPYGNEDLFTAKAPDIATRCTRDGATPGMCLSERRIGGSDLTFRFPRAWLAQWRGVADAMDKLTAQLHSSAR